MTKSNRILKGQALFGEEREIAFMRHGFPRFVLGFGCLFWSVGFVYAATILPPGFSETVLIEGNLIAGVSKVTDIKYEPGTGHLWVTEQGEGVSNGSARVRRRDANTGNVTTALNLPCVSSQGERGLLSLAFHPEFADTQANKRWVYLYYTRDVTSSGECATPGMDPGPHPTLSRFDEIGGTLFNETILLIEPYVAFSTNHNGGSIVFDHHNHLYLSIGDLGTGIDGSAGGLAREKDNFIGKVLRLDENGNAAPGNPFESDPTALPEIWAMGLRNPFTMLYDEQADFIAIGDVGEAAWEAIYTGVPGADYGWPCVEGSHPFATCDPPPPPGSLTNPVYEYHHGSLTLPVQGSAVMLGPIYRGNNFPAEYHNRRFFADHTAEWIRHAAVGPDGSLSDVQLFSENSNLIVRLIEDPDGCLTWAAYFEGVKQICATNLDNNQPQADAEAEPDNGLAPLEGNFDGSDSSDPDGDSLSYFWDFGDGNTSTQTSPEHTYVTEGVYDAVLEVDDGSGSPNSTDTEMLKIVVGNESPRGQILTPEANSRYNAGDTIFYSGRATDLQEGELPASAFTWTIIFHHDDHTHPFLGPITGSKSGSFTIPTDGERSANTWYNIRLEVADTGVPLGSEGVLKNLKSIFIYPNVSRMKLVASPPIYDLNLAIDGITGRAPRQLDSVVNFPRTIEAPTPQFIGNATMEFDSWSIGGPAEQTIDTPATDSIITANFSCTANCASLSSDEDSDGFTLLNGDCNDDDKNVWQPPSEVPLLAWSSQTQLDWLGPSTRGGRSVSVRYDVMRSPDARQFERLGTCVATDLSVRSHTDVDLPASGEVFFYLIAPVNNCPEMTPNLGVDSQQRDRIGPVCG